MSNSKKKVAAPVANVKEIPPAEIPQAAPSIPPSTQRDKIEAPRPVTAQERFAEIDNKIAEAKANGIFMLGVWTLEDGQIKLFRAMHNFPLADLENCVSLLKADLQGIGKVTPMGRKA